MAFLDLPEEMNAEWHNVTFTNNPGPEFLSATNYAFCQVSRLEQWQNVIQFKEGIEKKQAGHRSAYEWLGKQTFKSRVGPLFLLESITKKFH